jgi:hypothetical protein
VAAVLFPRRGTGGALWAILTMAVALTAALLLANAPTAAAASGKTVLALGFENGLGSWSRVTGRPAVQTKVVRTGDNALVTPRTKRIAVLRRNIPLSSAAAATFALKAHGGSQTFLRFARNDVSLALDGRRQIVVTHGAKSFRPLRLRPRDGWHRIAAEVQSKGDLLVLSVDGRLRARLRMSIGPESAVQLGDLEPRPSGPLFFDDITMVSKGQIRARMPTRPSVVATAPDPGPMSATRLFAPWSVWYRAAKTMTVRSNSATLVSRLLGSSYNWYFNHDSYTTTFYEVNNGPLVPITMSNSGCGSTGCPRLRAAFAAGFPLPPGAATSTGSDRHITVYDRGRDTLYELFDARVEGGRWVAHWGSVLEHTSQSNGVMPVVNGERWGATATGLPVIAGTIRLADLANGVIPYALAYAVAFDIAGSSFVPPATATDGGNSNGIPEGMRFRLPPTYEYTGTCPMLEMVTDAVRDYGMLVRDQSGANNFYGELAPSSAYAPYTSGCSSWWNSFPYDQLQAVQ